MAKPRKTRRYRKGSNINVRSSGALKAFESLLSRGPLTLVYINAKWCGACHKFNDDVWSPLTKLKNRSVNLASVDSEMIGKTSLANVPRKFYPTLMLVGKDKKPATFKDEEGNPTNAMPRNNTLSEDREAFTNLVINPNVSTGPSNPVSLASIKANTKPLSSSAASANLVPEAVSTPVATPVATPMATPVSTPMTNSKLINLRGSPPRSNVTIKSLAKSPFESRNSILNSMGTTASTAASTPLQISKPIQSSSPPDIGSDLVASQMASRPMVPTAIKGGRMLQAIRNRSASLKAMLNLRKTRKNRR